MPVPPSSDASFSRQSGGSVRTTASITRNWMKSHIRAALSPPRNVYSTMITPEMHIAQKSGKPSPTPTTVPMASSLNELSRNCIGRPSQASILHMRGV